MDEFHLIQAIKADYEDDTCKLVYADYLEESGRPLQAEFIRAAIVKDTGYGRCTRCEASIQGTPRNGPCRCTDHYLSCVNRYFELFDQHGGEFAGVTPTGANPTVYGDTVFWDWGDKSYHLPRLRGVHFHKGFVRGVECTGEDFLKRVGWLQERHPLVMHINITALPLWDFFDSDMQLVYFTGDHGYNTRVLDVEHDLKLTLGDSIVRGMLEYLFPNFVFSIRVPEEI